MQREKRKPRSYKISDKPYFKAMRKLSKSGVPLASLIESLVIEISNSKQEVIDNYFKQLDHAEK